MTVRFREKARKEGEGEFLLTYSQPTTHHHLHLKSLALIAMNRRTGSAAGRCLIGYILGKLQADELVNLHIAFRKN
jgi:hypothetical protein